MTLASRQIHLDFHTGKLPFDLGKNFNKKEFQKTMVQSHVNSVTLTARCHNGWVYYQSPSYTRHPQLGSRDLLSDEVEALHAVGIKTPLYETVGWDAYSAKTHPEWLERKVDGSLYGFEDHSQIGPGWKTLCLNSPYVDYLIGEIKDLFKYFKYRLDGIFFDIVWQDPCYCNSCIDSMLKLNVDFRDQTQVKNFAKKVEINFKKRIKEVIDSLQPDCPIVFNEGNITPEIRPSLDDYDHLEIESLPGGDWGYQHFPVTVRYAKTLGKDYLGMTGRFHKSWGDFGSYKNYEALEYENLLALVHGAKCSIGDQMYPDGTLSTKAYGLIERIYKKVEKYEKYSIRTEAITQIAIVHPAIVSDYENDDKVDVSLAGAVNLLNEGHFLFDIIDLQANWNKYEVIVLPDKIVFNSQIKDKVLRFQKQGGKVLATYLSGSDHVTGKFPDKWSLINEGVTTVTPFYGKYHTEYFKNLEDAEYVLHGESLLVSLSRNFKGNIIGDRYKPLYNRSFEHYYGHYQAPIGEIDKNHPIGLSTNSFVYFVHPLFKMYKTQGNNAYKHMITDALKYLLSNHLLLRFEGLPSTADVVLNKQTDKRRFIIAILNYVPQRTAEQIDTISDIFPINDLKIEINWHELMKLSGVSSRLINVQTAVNEEKLKVNNKDTNRQFTISNIKGYEFIILNY